MSNLNFRQILRYDDRIIDGVIGTLQLTAISALCGALIGLTVAFLLKSKLRPVSLLARAYVEVIRNTPQIIQIFLIFFMLPAIGLRFPPFEAAAIALSVYFGAYAAEIFRAGIASIPRSQLEAAHCLGITTRQVYQHVVFWPALRNVYPALTGQFMLLLLGTSVASQISADELLHAAGFIDSRTYRSFEVYALVAAIYVAMVTVARLMFAAFAKLFFRWPTSR